MYVTKIIRINHDNVASRGAVGRTHIIVRFQTGNRRKHQFERRISWVSYMSWIDFHNGIWGCGFLCTLLITLYFVSILSLFCVSISRLTRRGLPRPIYIPPATTPRATTPHLYRTGHHAFTTTAQLSRLCISRPRHAAAKPHTSPARTLRQGSLQAATYGIERFGAASLSRRLSVQALSYPK